MVIEPREPQCLWFLSVYSVGERVRLKWQHLGCSHSLLYWICILQRGGRKAQVNSAFIDVYSVLSLERKRNLTSCNTAFTFKKLCPDRDVEETLMEVEDNCIWVRPLTNRNTDVFCLLRMDGGRCCFDSVPWRMWWASIWVCLQRQNSQRERRSFQVKRSMWTKTTEEVCLEHLLKKTRALSFVCQNK